MKLNLSWTISHQHNSPSFKFKLILQLLASNMLWKNQFYTFPDVYSNENKLCRCCLLLVCSKDNSVLRIVFHRWTSNNDLCTFGTCRRVHKVWQYILIFQSNKWHTCWDSSMSLYIVFFLIDFVVVTLRDFVLLFGTVIFSLCCLSFFLYYYDFFLVPSW